MILNIITQNLLVNFFFAIVFAFTPDLCLVQLCNKHSEFLENGAPPLAQVDDP